MINLNRKAFKTLRSKNARSSQRKIYTTFLIAISLIPGLSCTSTKPAFYRGFQERESNTNSISSGQGPKLSQALKTTLSTEPISSDRKKLIEEWSRRGRLDQCEKKFPKETACAFLKSDWVKEVIEEENLSEEDVEIASTQKSAKSRNQRIERIRKSFEKGIIPQKESELRPGDYFLALKKYKGDFKSLETISEQLVRSSECREPELYHYLGLKWEEKLPEKEALKRVKSIYEKTAQCYGQQIERMGNRFISGALFRRGLFAVSEKDCSHASEFLMPIATGPVSDYSTRARYWSAVCARIDDDPSGFFSHFDELFKANPLGFHTISLSEGESLLVKNLSKPIDPRVMTRSRSLSRMNDWIQFIEQADRLGHSSLVMKLFSSVRKHPEILQGFEPPVRLYLASLAHRSGDSLGLFRILDSVFRTQSEYVVDSTLKLFYPMKHMQTIQGNAKVVPPLLISALIRQESAYQENAKSPVGALGLMQLMPRTAKIVDRTTHKKNLLNPEVNIRVGIKYFESLVNRFDGDVELALASYNAGPEVVDRWVKRYPVKNRLLFLDLIPYGETRNYVTLIGRNYYWYTKLYPEYDDKDAVATNNFSFDSVQKQ